MWFEPFFLNALAAGIGVALMCGVLGCFVAWKRMAYFGDTVAHAALLGVVLSLLLEMDVEIGIVVVSVLVALGLFYFQRQKKLASDSLLGVVAHGALAVGLVLLSFSSSSIDIGGYLFGDILAVNGYDIAIIYASAAAVYAVMYYYWNDMLRVTLHEDIAQVEGVNVVRAKLVLVLLIALAVAVSIKIIGMLLITALLIIPAAAARYFARTPAHMALLASGAGIVSVIIGLAASATWDTASGPSIVVAAIMLFIGAHAVSAFKR